MDKEVTLALGRELFQGLADFLMPTRCKGCGEFLRKAPTSNFCAVCWAGVVRIQEPVCAHCGKPLASRSVAQRDPRCYFCRQRAPEFVLAREAVVYEGALKKAVRLFKFRGRTTLG